MNEEAVELAAAAIAAADGEPTPDPYDRHLARQVIRAITSNGWRITRTRTPNTTTGTTPERQALQ